MIRKIIGWTLAASLSVTLFLLIILLVFAGTLGSNLTDFSFIKQELRDVEAYSLAKQWMQENIEDIIPGLEETDLFQVFSDSLSEEWLADQVDGVLDTVSDYLDEESDTLDISLSLVGFKENLKTVLHDTIHESPPEGLQELSAEELDVYLEAANTAIDELPEDITVVVNDASKLEPLRNLPDIISHVSALFTMIAALLVVFLILIHLLLLQSSLRAGGLFAGTFMFVTGITCFIVKAIIISATSSAVNNADLPSPLTAEVVNRLISDSLAQTTIWAVVFTLLGIAAIAASIFLLKGEKPDNTYSPY